MVFACRPAQRSMPLPCQTARTALDLIGSTPMVRLNRLPQLDGVGAEVWAKLENLNPGGSVKDRICLAMVEAAERDGLLAPGGTIIEPTSGNTGIGLALVAAVKGYRLVLTMPDTMSEERRSLLVAYGARLVLTPDTKGMHGAVRRAEELLAQHPDWSMPQQFTNPANPEAHRQTTAREILAQLSQIDAFVAGVGTGGTITGVGEVLRAERPHVRIYAVEPSCSPVLSGGEPGYHRIQGIGAGFVPEILNTDIYDEVLPVADDEAVVHARALARYEGLLVGISSGANCAAAIGVAHLLVDVDELAIEGYAANPINRCFFCKDNLFDVAAAEAGRRGLAVVLDGANVDDLADHRPGLRAAAEHGVRHPLVEAGFSKDEIRAGSRALGLSTWDRPASPCLSSRFPYGTRITAERLAQVAAAERFLRAQGLRELRVRHHEHTARLEVPVADMPRLLVPGVREAVVQELKRLGFAYVALDLQGFRSGSLNETPAVPETRRAGG